MAQPAGIIGNVGPFDPKEEKWANYQLRLELWMTANKIANELKVPTLLTVVGPSVFETVSSLVFPAKVTEKTYAQLVAVLSKHYATTSTPLAARLKFTSRKQKDSESVSDFIAELKRLTVDCKYQAEDKVEERLIETLCHGVKSEKITKRLLDESTKGELKWDKACEIALSMELVDRDLRGYGSGAAAAESSSVNKVKHRPQNSQKTLKCTRCHGNHHANNCRHKKTVCYECGKVGHIGRACLNSKSADHKSSYQDQGSSTRGRGRGGHFRGRGGRGGKGRKQTHYVGEADCDSESNVDSLNAIYHSDSKPGSSDEYKVKLNVNGSDLPFTIDTAASVTIIGENTYRRFFKNLPCVPSAVKLFSYSGQEIPTIGEISVDVKYKQTEKNLKLVVAKGKKVSLLGRNWLKQIKLDWKEVFSVKQNHQRKLDDLLKKYAEVFEGDGTIKGFKAEIHMKEGTKPVFHKHRPVPYALRGKVDNEIDRLETSESTYKVDRSDWASPIVVVPKSDGNVRICGDFKVSVNPHIEDEPYPLPTAEDIFAKLAGKKRFTVLDLSHAYSQLEVDEGSRKYLTINTPKGLYRYRKLPYGIKTAPHIFQKVIDQVLAGLNNVDSFQDDIIIGEDDDDEYLKNLELVLERLAKFGIKLKRSKCRFNMTWVEYLGHRIDADGIHPTQDKIDAIVNAKVPQNKSELRSLLGLINYYGKFLSNLSSRLEPLHCLLRSENRWFWSEDCDRVLDEIKKEISGDKVLAHYDPKLPLSLATDASPYGVGAVLSQTSKDGVERPVAFASRTLSPTERNYAQIEREALGIIFGVKRFHKYLYGRKFTLITDSEPLTAIFGPKKGVPTLAALRLQRWSLILMAYDYDIVYRKTSLHGNADFCSRLPTTSSKNDKLAAEEKINYFTHVNSLPVTAEDVARETRKDPVLSKVYHFAQSGWPSVKSEKQSDEFRPYFRIRNEISCDQGCLLWGMRVIIPPCFHDRLIDEIHYEHLGMVRTKALARSYFWFPKLDQRIEDMISNCGLCQSLQTDPPLSPLYPWRYTEKPWSRLHIDFGEYHVKHYLILVDSYSKWPEVVKMSSTDATRTIDALRNIFCAQGIPETLVSDNGPPFQSEEFELFCASNGIKHIPAPPYHPATNGQAENCVKTVKRALKKHFLDTSKSNVSDSHKLASFLLTYRNTPHSVTGRTPAELLNKRKLRTRLDLLRPDMRKFVEKKQDKQKSQHDVRVQLREFEKNERVRVKNWRDNKDVKFVPGTVVRRLGPLRYLVDVGGKARFVHADHMRKTGEGDDGLPRANSGSNLNSDSTRNFQFDQYKSRPVSFDTDSDGNDSPEIVSVPSPQSVASPKLPQTPRTAQTPSAAQTFRAPQTPKVTRPVASGSPNSGEGSAVGTETQQCERRYPMRNRKPNVKFKDYVPIDDV